MEWKMTEECENVSLVESYMEGTTLYAAGFDRNILLKYDLDGRILVRLGWFDGFRFPVSYQNVGIYKFEDSLFCFSLNSYEVAEYDLRTQIFRYYCPEENDYKPETVCTVCRIGDEVWMFREVFDTAVMVFSMTKKAYHRNFVNFNKRDRVERYVRHVFENSAYIGTRVWRCVPGSSELMALDTEKLEACIVKTGLQFSFTTMNCEGKCLYIISEDGRNLVVFNTDNVKARVYGTGYDGAVNHPFAGAAEVNGRIFLFPSYEKEIFCYEKKGEEL